MPFSVNTNYASLISQKNTAKTELALNKSMTRLSSGLRVNGAADDAAGLAIAKKMGAEVSGMGVAIRNANDAVSLLQVAEGSQEEIGNILERMKNLALQSANGTNQAGQRTNLNAEFTQLIAEIDRIVDTTKFNGSDLLQGNTAISFQIDVGDTATDTANAISFTLSDLDATTLAVNASTIDTDANAQLAIAAIDTAITTVTTARAEVGAYQNRFEKTINNLQNRVVNVSQAAGRIMDTDFGAETASLAKSNILQQAGISMMAQSKAMSQGVLSLLQ
jgi:flagellin